MIELFTSRHFMTLMILAACTIAALYSMHRTRKSCAERQAKSLAAQVTSLRLAKMLDKLGIPRAGYLEQLPPEIICGHIENCRRCTLSDNVHLCDAYLERGKAMKSIRFCPNYLSLLANSKEFYRRNRQH